MKACYFYIADGHHYGPANRWITKFGISHNPTKRINQQRHKCGCIFEIKHTFKFSDRKSAFDFERLAIKQDWPRVTGFEYRYINYKDVTTWAIKELSK